MTAASRSAPDLLDRRWVVPVLLLLAAVPLLGPDVPPLIDVPGHMARFRVMLGTDAALLDQWYAFDWKLIGYIGFDVMIALLAPIVGLEPAVKLMTIAIPVVATAGILFLSRAVHGRIQPSALFAIPIVYHMTFLYGFLNYAMAMALMLNAVALWIWLGKRGRPGLRAALFVPVSCGVWLFHVMGWMTLGLAVFAAEWTIRRERGEPLVRGTWLAGLSCIPLCLPMLAFLGWAPAGDETGSDFWASLYIKPIWPVTMLRDRWPVLDLASIAILLLVFYAGWRSPVLRYARPLVAVAAAFFALFIAMPFLEAYADARIVPYAAIVALVAIGPAAPDSPTHRGLFYAGALFLVVRLASATASIAIESADWDRRLVAVDQIPRGSRVAAFSTFPCLHAWRMKRTGHIAGMATVRRASFVNDQYDLGPSALLKVRDRGLGKFSGDPSQIVANRPCKLDPDYPTLERSLAAFPRDKFDYVWLIDPVLRPGMTNGLKPVWTDGRDLLLKIEGPSATRRDQPPQR
jgi:hypothetical protein